MRRFTRSGGLASAVRPLLGSGWQGRVANRVEELVDGGADLAGELAAPTEFRNLIAVRAAQEAQARPEVHVAFPLRSGHHVWTGTDRRSQSSRRAG